MGLSSAVERRASPENPSTSLANPAGWLTGWFGGGPTKAGTQVNESNSLSLSGVWAGVRLLSSALAMTPLVAYERVDRGKERRPQHPAYRLLHERPNPEMTPYTFKETIQAHAVLWGGGFAEIERNHAGVPIGLWPLLPDRTFPERRGGLKVYRVRVEENQDIYLASNRVMHIPGLSWDGVLGYNLVKIARESLGLAKAVEEDAARFFGNGSQVSGVLSTEGSLNDKQRSNVKESWDQMHTGLSNRHRTALLEAGLKWQQIGIDPKEAQNLESRQFSVSEVARWLGVPPHMIGDLSRSTNNNIEEQGLEFLRYALNRWLVQWEQTVSYDLFGESERGPFFAEFLREALLAMDSEKQGQFFRELFQAAAISPNEIRAKLNMNTYPGGDVYMLPLNMASSDEHADVLARGGIPEGRARIVGPDAGLWRVPEPEARALPAPEVATLSLSRYRERRSITARRKIRTTFEPLLEDAATVVFTREVNAATRALDKAKRSLRAVEAGVRRLANGPGGCDAAIDRSTAEERMANTGTTVRGLCAAAQILGIPSPIDERGKIMISVAVQVGAMIEGVSALMEAEFALGDFDAWITDFYSTYPEYATERFAKTIRAMSESIFGEVASELESDAEYSAEVEEFARRYTTKMGEREAASSVAQLRAIMRDTPPEEVEAALRGRLDGWKEKRAAKFARRATSRSVNALARESYRAQGVKRLVWVTNGSENCPLCRKLDGKTAEITGAFLRKGQTVDPDDGETEPLTTKKLIRHPPLHAGCDCTIAPA